MVKSSTTIMAVAMLVGLIFTGLPSLEAQSPMGAPMMSPGSPMAPAPTTDCMTAVFSAADCLDYVTIGSNATAPNKACCPEVATLLQNNPLCLCTLVGQAKAYNVDVQRALKLPGACKLQTPPLSLCPGLAPTPSPTSEGPGSSSPGGLAPEGGAAMTPSASGNSGNNGASTTAVHHFSALICFVVAIFIASYF